MTAHRIGLLSAPPTPQHGGLFHCNECFALARANGLTRWEAMLVAARCLYVRHHL